MSTMFRAVVAAVTLLSTVASETSCIAGSVAFSATLTTMVTIPFNQIVVYDSVISNQGNGYNNITGVFTAPRGGTYLFLLHALSQANQRVLLTLYKNDEVFFTVYAHQPNGHCSGGNSAIIKVKRGDIFSVKTGRDSAFVGDSQHYNIFSGYLIA